MASFINSLLPRLGLIAVALFCIAPSSALAGENPAGQHAFTITPPTGNFTLEDLNTVVKNAAMKHGWEVKEDTPDRVVIYLNQRRNEATVTFLLTTDRIEAYCEGYESRNGVRGKPEQPRGWLRRLHSDIAQLLGMPRPSRN